MVAHVRGNEGLELEKDMFKRKDRGGRQDRTWHPPDEV